MSLPLPVTSPTMPPSKGTSPSLRAFSAPKNLLANVQPANAETAKHECVSEDALQHLKTYKYSSVDKSFISRYILKHYVRLFCPTAASYPDVSVVEWLCGATAPVDCTESRHIIRLLLHTRECCFARTVCAGSSRTGELEHISKSVPDKKRLISSQAPSWVYYSFAFGMWM